MLGVHRLGLRHAQPELDRTGDLLELEHPPALDLGRRPQLAQDGDPDGVDGNTIDAGLDFVPYIWPEAKKYGSSKAIRRPSSVPANPSIPCPHSAGGSSGPASTASASPSRRIPSIAPRSSGSLAW